MKTQRHAGSAILIALFCALAAAPAASPPLPAGGAGAVRIPVAVRVVEGGSFVGDLGLKDFELDESGMASSPSALFLIRKGRVEREEGTSGLTVDLSRKLHLVFQLNDYPAKIAEAMDYFFRQGLLPGDSLEIQTPVRNYGLSAENLAAKPRAVLAQDLTKIIRRDVVQGAMAYNSLLRELKTLVRLIGGTPRGLSDTEGEADSNIGLELMLLHYREDLEQAQRLRVLNEDTLVAFAAQLRQEPGQKFVFHFYQREFRPEISPNVLDTLVMDNQDKPGVLAEVQTLFQMYHHSITMNRERLRRAFADSAANLNFLFINKPPDQAPGINMREQSEDIFQALSTAAEATGGTVQTSQDPLPSIQAAVAAADSYYLLYFTPSAAGPPGTFLDLDVRLRGRGGKVLHPLGYFTR